ncbi:MAG: HypC/HybG/HupF family hydrogenase formation chaperone [Firmicutes bacterium]|nr:HypC/HybG/HupF family hydrogenase formation chaperone [Bacillota bacterium]
MCLAVPLRIKEINGEDAVAERDGVSRKIKVGFIKDPKPGDYVIVHAGFAIERVDEQQAIDDLEAWKEFQDAINS